MTTSIFHLATQIGECAAAGTATLGHSAEMQAIVYHRAYNAFLRESGSTAGCGCRDCQREAMQEQALAARSRATARAHPVPAMATAAQ